MGALQHLAAATRAAGRGPDRHLVHLSDKEMGLLHHAWGPPDVNPRTGLPEYGWFDSILSAALPIVGAAIPGLGSGIGDALGASGPWSSVLGNAILGGGAGLLTSGGDWKKALLGAGLGGGAAALGPLLSNELAGTGIGDFLGMTGGNNTVFGQYPQGAMQSQYFASDPGSRMDSYANDPAFQSPAGSTGALARGASTMGGGGGGSGAGGGSGGSSSWLKYALPAVTLLGILGGNKGQPSAPMTQTTGSSGGGGALPKLTWDMRPKDTSKTDWWTYGERAHPTTSFFDPILKNADGTPYAADGGYVDSYARGGLSALGPSAMTGGGSQYVGAGPGSGRGDQIPARLSPNEYVLDSETVSMLGDGSPDEGARRLDKMRSGIRQHKGPAMSRGRLSPNAKPPMAYMRGGRS